MFAFIPPATPLQRPLPPAGPTWVHEAKIDGWRALVRRDEAGVAILSRAGTDLTTRFHAIAEAALALPVDTMLDGEIVGVGDDGLPDFHRTGRRGVAHDLYVFDLLWLRDVDLRPEPLSRCRAELVKVVAKVGEPVKLVEAFADAAKLLATAEAMGLEGIVSKRLDQPYRSGTRCGWIKVKTRSWRDRNRERWRAVERARDCISLEMKRQREQQAWPARQAWR